jgi:hypothetical protein
MNKLTTIRVSMRKIMKLNIKFYRMGLLSKDELIYWGRTLSLNYRKAKQLTS